MVAVYCCACRYDGDCRDRVRGDDDDDDVT